MPAGDEEQCTGQAPVASRKELSVHKRAGGFDGELASYSIPEGEELCPLSVLRQSVRLEFDPPLPHPFLYPVAWAKCDMLATVGFDRLDIFRTERDQYGRRKRPPTEAALLHNQERHAG